MDQAEKWALVICFGALGVGLFAEYIKWCYYRFRFSRWIKGVARVDFILDEVRGFDTFAGKCIACKYVYNFKGIEYRGDAISILNFVHSIFATNWDEGLFVFLKQSHETNVQVPVWINPTRPDCAILSKKSYASKFQMLLAGAFGCAAVVIFEISK